MDNSESNVREQVLGWLNGQGYPLEMAVAAAFHASGFSVRLSDYYVDPESGKEREIDVTAGRNSEPGTDEALLFSVTYRLECKLARAKPWVVFVSEAQPDRMSPALHVISSEATRLCLLNSLGDADVRQRLNGLELFRRNRIGHGVTQAFTNGPDEPYKAVMSALKASAALARRLDERAVISGLSRKIYMGGIVVPVVIIEGTLFECSLGQAGQLEAMEVKSSVIGWKGGSYALGVPLVHVVTRPALDDFVRIAGEAADAFISTLLAHKEIFTHAADMQALPDEPRSR